MPAHEQLNLTPFAAGLGVCQDKDGREVAVAVVRATFAFDPKGGLQIAPPGDQAPVQLADKHHGDPGSTSVRYASDLVPTKDGTDVAVVGHAYGRGRPSVQAGFRLGALEKLLVVSGPRVWVGGAEGAIAGPVPFERMPVRYELAYGGTYQLGGRDPVSYPENPVGVGFHPNLPDRSPLPSVEYDGSRFKTPRSHSTPAGLGFIPPGWKQRSRFAGTFDEAWMKARRPLLPADLDERFYNAVPQDQVLRPKLRGGEPLTLRNLHREAEAIHIAVPRLAFESEFQVRGQSERVAMVCDTLLVEPDLGRLALSYRASLAVGADVVRLARVVFRAAAG